jgi:NAD(P)-dependent dehydrogenase (short-subunit alcohol dehydrogenase family)
MAATKDIWDLSGRVAVVTGGSRGLGSEISRAFAAHGATVVVSSRKAAGCEELVAEIEAAGGSALAVAANAGRWEDCDALVESVYAKLGKVDVLVNNAGMSPLYEKLTDVTEALFDKVIAVNLRGPFRLATLIAERMASGEGGSIVNISSMAAIRPSEEELPYAMAKAGLNNMTSGLAATYGPRVRVNTIMPGPFLTDISQAWNMEQFKRDREPFIPLERAGQPEEIVGAALYLASDASSYCTGAALTIDGGWSRTVGKTD